jgi:hypothetical protein
LVADQGMIRDGIHPSPAARVIDTFRPIRRYRPPPRLIQSTAITPQCSVLINAHDRNTSRVAMFRTQQLSQIVLRSVMTRDGDLMAEGHAGVAYIGLGDCFDDDRRLVRETASTRRAGGTAQWGWSFRALRN